ncbi:hypothetical protein [Streptomyces botrytidirepellens]|uniref:Regulatory protein n=1 Tax=Streptomyces botrytidirepellens TaxID=2486417 RepID=A0A3M8SK45_9ACTN|nr:hypothetical protein [Streptomyces botrytidirepellens]RNF81163.1 hypothetical protein EEJ42_47120 [Streptomyces botrytidirepellens]
MADEPEKITPIQDRVRQQLADNLVANRKEQEKVTAQLAALQKQVAALEERLAQLKLDEAWLAQAQGSLPTALAQSEPAAGAAEELSAAPAEQPETSAPAKAVTDEPRTVPQPRQNQPVKAARSKQPAKKTTAAAKKTTAKKTTAKKSAAKKATAKKTTAKKPAAEQAPKPKATATKASAKKTAARGKSRPPLWELILGILLKTPGQPCVAREVTNQLVQDHPGRATSVQAVRNNLEILVNKNLAEKSRQQGNSMYTAYADAAADEPVGGEGKQAPETAEKVPAEV